MTQKVSFEWRVVEEADWDRLPAGTLTLPAVSGAKGGDERWVIPLMLRSAAVLLVAWISISAIHPEPPPAQPAPAATAVAAVLQREAAAWQSSDGERINAVLAPEVRFEWRNEWRTPYALAAAMNTTVTEQVIDESVRDHLMQVTLLVHAPTPWTLRPVTYRETRFYRPGEEGWLRTVPPPHTWGEEHTLETPHLRFQFRTRDTATVLAILERTEAIYLLLHELVALDPALTADKLTFRIDPRLVTGWAYFGRIQPLSSPSLARVPEGMNDADYLTHTITNRVTGLILNQLAMDREREAQANWQMLVWGLNGWMRTDLHARRSPWHRRVEMMLVREQATMLPFRLADLLDSPLQRPYEQRTFMHQYLLVESVVGYILTAYGRDQLPELLTVLRDHGSWQVAPQELLGVSPAEFESNWNRFVATHYLGAQ
jgi:hypothetical protein